MLYLFNSSSDQMKENTCYYWWVFYLKDSKMNNKFLLKSFADSLRDSQRVESKLTSLQLDMIGYHKWYNDNKSMIPWWIPSSVAKRMLRGAYFAGREEGYRTKKDAVVIKRPIQYTKAGDL